MVGGAAAERVREPLGLRDQLAALRRAGGELHRHG
jgi:hypothetical protein